MGNDDRSKMSWRDIDKRRDGSRGGTPRSGSGEPRPGSQEEHSQKQYRAALEAAFAKGELGKLADKLNISAGPSTPPARTPTPTPTPAASDDAGDAPAAAAGDAPAEAGAEATATPTSGGPKKSGKGKKVEDERLTLRRKLAEAAGRQEISRAAEKFLARYPLPDDHELLEQLLEHDKESRVREAIGRINDLIDRRQPPRRSRALSGKLKYIVETTYDEELRQAAQALLSRLT